MSRCDNVPGHATRVTCRGELRMGLRPQVRRSNTVPPAVVLRNDGSPIKGEELAAGERPEPVTITV